VAALVGMDERNIHPEVITFADTGAEKPETYAYIETMNDWLKERDWPLITIVKNDGMYAGLEDNCLRKNMLPSLAYGFKSCSDKYKRRPQDKFIKEWAKQRGYWDQVKITKVIGFDAGEPHRMGNFEDEHFDYWYPLVEWGWHRGDCIEAIQRSGLPVPMKSSCFFCPASRKNEIKWLAQNHPDLFARAVAMERNANLETIKGLGRRFSWEEFVKAEESQFNLFPESPQIPCMCFDGEEDD
jgi:hypothetical protein